MNSTQVQNILLPIISGLAGWLAGAHILFDASTWSNILLGVVSIGTAVWAGITSRKTALISATAALPEVQSIKLEQTATAAMAAPANVSK